MGDRKQTSLVVAEIVFGVESERESTSALLNEDYRPFLTSAEPDVLLTVSESALPALFPLESHRVFDAWDKWGLYGIDGQKVLVQRHPISSAIPDRIIIIDSEFRRGELFIRSPGPSHLGLPHPLDYPLGQVLMVWLLAQGRGLMVHACGVSDNGRGYVLAGNSGHGKTTLAEIWQSEARILNDDRIILRKKDGRFWMYGTPWRGANRSVSPQGVPVEKIFFPKHAVNNGAKRVVGAQAASMILTRCFPPVWDAEGMAYTLDFLSELTSQVPCYELAFSPDDQVRDFIRCVK